MNTLTLSRRGDVSYRRTRWSAVIACVVLGWLGSGVGYGQSSQTPRASHEDAPVQQAPTTLGPGHKAPAVKSSLEWIKGEPITSFQQGKVYVFEFWATWCGPCVASIPHLTELAHRYKEKVIITGVTAEDSNNTRMIVEDFVTSKGDEMDYRVAFDPMREMYDAYMTAANQNGIPTAFVIDTHGTIVWIGHPADPAFEKTIEAVLEGSFDLQEAQKAWKKQEEAQRKAMEEAQKSSRLIEQLNQAWDAGDKDTALKLADDIVAINPQTMQQWAIWKYRALTTELNDMDRARKYALNLAKTTYSDDPTMLIQLADMAIESLDASRNDYNLALTIAQQAVDITDEQDAQSLGELAKVYLGKKDYTKAIATMQRAVDMATSPQLRAYFANELEWYKAEEEMAEGG